MTAIETLLARPFVTTLGWGLLHSLWEVAAVAVVAAVALRVLRRASPQARYLVACGAMALMGALPAATTWHDVSGTSDTAAVVAEGSTVSWEGKDRGRDPALDDDDLRGQGQLLAGASVPAPRLADRVAPVLPMVVAAWAAGVFVLSIRLVGGWLLVQRLARRGTRPVAGECVRAFDRLCRRLAVSRPVRLLESSAVRVPMVVGWLRPAVLLPVSALTGLTPDQLEAILAHELAHVRRHDYLVNLLQSVVETLLFYHPAAWWLGRRIREEREHCCDDEAVAACGDRLAYARALTAMEELRSGTWALAPSAGGKPLLARIRRLLGVAPVEERPAGGLAGLVALASIAALGLALVVAPGAGPARADVEAGPAVVGTVANSDGSPARGADLWLVDVTLPHTRAVVLGRAKSEADGRFRIARREVKDAGSLLGALVLWAHRPDGGVARAVLKKERSSPEPRGPVRLALAPTGESAVRVLDPGGAPVAGAAVSPLSLKADRGFLPEELAGRLGSATDATGRATLKAGAPEAVGSVRVTTPGHGSQLFHYHGEGLKPGADLRLKPVGRVEGRVTASDPAAARGLKLYLATSPRELPNGGATGHAEVVTDGDGRFTVPALAEGSLSVDVPMPDNARERALLPARSEVKGMRRVELEVPLKRLVRVRGIVREKGAGTPVADVVVRFYSREVANPNTIPTTRTDAQGRFEALAPPGPTVDLSLYPPKAYLRTLRSTVVRIAEEDGQSLPPLEVERGATIRGRVVDEAGRPVPGVTVEGKWPKVHSRSGSMQTVVTLTATATSAAAGQFLLEGIDPGATVSMEVQDGEARTERPQTGQPGAADPVTLRVSAANVVALSGRVVTPDGKPIAGARVRVRSREAGRDALPSLGYVQFDDSDEVRTGADGRFRTPRRLRRGYAYSAEVRADGRLSETTPWLLLEPGTEPTLPDLTLLGLRALRGRVVDDRGRPVAGAVVRVTGDAPTPVRATTDAQGRFTLAEVLDGTGFVFVEKPGFRFQGQRYGPGAGDLDVTVVPQGGPPPAPMASLRSPLARDEELALLHRVLDPYSAQVLKQGAEKAGSVLTILTRAEPALVLELIDREGFADGRTRDWLRSDLARRLASDSLDDALAQIESIRDASSRSYAAYLAAAALPAGERTLKLDVLGQALVSARAMDEPGERAMRLAAIGEQYLDLGEARRAADLLREAESIARQVPENGRGAFARGTVAEELAQVDLPAALDLIRGTGEQRDRDAHLGRIAQELAGRSPAEAERVLLMMKDVWPNFRDGYAQRVCHRMAPVDPARARRLAAAMKDYRYQARAYGAMALALAPRDPSAAARLLADAFGVLDAAVEQGKDQWNGLGTACTAAAGLLPVVEAVDPRFVQEYLWRTLALRPSLRGPDTRDGIADLSNAQVAAMAARYDRESARTVFDAFAPAAVARLKGMARRDLSFEVRSLFTAAAAVDPARAVTMVEEMPDEPGTSPDGKIAARLAVAGVLASEGLERWRGLESSLLHVWRIDSEQY